MRKDGAGAEAKASQEASCQSEHPDSFKVIEIHIKVDHSE